MALVLAKNSESNEYIAIEGKGRGKCRIAELKTVLVPVVINFTLKMRIENSPRNTSHHIATYQL